jgi:SAM-dependent methyltransferase
MSTEAATQPVPGLHPTACAICGTLGDADERWPATLDPSAFTPEVFSARRLPDRVHYRMVNCRHCGLLRSDPVLDEEALIGLYREASFDYGDELDSLRETYGGALSRIEALTPDRDGLLDIGCGNGFVLEEALKRGWTGVRGVEPTADAIAAAAPSVRGAIVEDIMRPGLFAPDSLTAVTLFQVLDHIPDPLSLLRECRAALKPGGVIMAWNHNTAAASARILGERSPIVDVEHTYLYSPDTMRTLFGKAGFEVVDVSAVRNLYSLSYLVHLVPLPRTLKERAVPVLRRTRIGRTRVRVPLGNLCLVARA